MSTCSVKEFVITKGEDNTFTFTIKQDGTTLPMELTLSDTFSAKLIKLSDEVVALNVPLTLDSNLLSGKVYLTIVSVDTLTLDSERGTKVDRYYTKPMYKLTISCDTANNGVFLAKIPTIYID